ncbi:DUF4142 domain-containing protein [Dyella monticola]|nr:DUF4142 domain-containing protein [Dyella monticola]
MLCFVIVPAVATATKTVHAQRRALDAREQAFVAQATSDDAMQIALGKLAMTRSANPRLRALASRIVSDHAALNLQFAKLASSSGHAHGLSPQAISAMKAHLESLHGEAFDQAFTGMMVWEHRKVIAAYEVAAKTSADPTLRTIAMRGIPVLQGHLDAVRALMAQSSSAEQRQENE